MARGPSKNPKPFKFLFAGLGILLLSWSGWHFIAAKEVARVGSYALYQRDLQDQEKINKLMGGAAAHPDVLKQLIELHILTSILAAQGFDLSEEALEQEAQRIDRETQDPTTLERIKAVFGSRRGDYLRLFIRPTLVKRSIYFEYYVRRRELHQATFSAAETFLAKVVKEGRDFGEQAKSRGLTVVPVQLDEETDPQSWEGKLSKTLKPGETSGEIVDLNEALLVVHRKTVKDKVELEAAVFKKRPYEDWLAEQRTKIHIHLL